MQPGRQIRNRARRPLLLTALVVVMCLPLVGATQEAGDAIVKQGRIAQDIYLAGGTIDMLADVDGDVIAAGGQINIDQSVSGDILVAGGNISIRARVGDDVRAAGGNITVSGAVGDEAVIGGGNILISPTASIGGRALLGGGNIRIEGKVGKGVKAGGNRVVIDGDITGDVEVFAETVEIGPRATIRGNLLYYSRQEAQIASGAKISGAVTQQQFDVEHGKRERSKTFGPIARLALYVTLMVTGVVLYLLFPIATVGAAQTVNTSPWKSLGLGFAMIAATPLIALLLLISFVGIWLGLLVLAMYLALWLLGFLTGVFTVGEWGLRLIGRAQTATKGWRVVSVVVALLVLWIVRLAPVLGGIAVFALLIFGLGALTLYLWRRYVSA